MQFRKLGFPMPPVRASGVPASTEARHASTSALQLVRNNGAPSDSTRHASHSGTDLGLVLDTLGTILATFARHTFDMPDRPATDSSAELLRWQRHATLGVPVTPDGGATAASVHSREWSGVVRTFVEHRRHEKRFVDAAIGDLRDALLASIQTVHNAVQIDVSSDLTVTNHVERARTAIATMQLGSIKGEVIGALESMQNALQVRRNEQSTLFKTLSANLDSIRHQLVEARADGFTDALTSLGNRKLFDKAVRRALEFHSLRREPMSLLLIDVDNLKAINDSDGHQGGDHAIVGVAKCLSKVFERDTDLICRYGGDEFVAVLHNTDTRLAQTLAKRLVSLVGEIVPPSPMNFRIGVSVGIAEIQPMDDAATWVARSDTALLHAKQKGRSCVVVADAQMTAATSLGARRVLPTSTAAH